MYSDVCSTQKFKVIRIVYMHALVATGGLQLSVARYSPNVNVGSKTQVQIRFERTRVREQRLLDSSTRPDMHMPAQSVQNNNNEACAATEITSMQTKRCSTIREVFQAFTS